MVAQINQRNLRETPAPENDPRAGVGAVVAGRDFSACRAVGMGEK